MAFSKKFSILLIFTVCLTLLVSACGSQSNNTATETGNSSAPSTETPKAETTKPAGAKIKLTLMFAWPGDTFAAEEEKMVKEHFADKYDITFKAVDGNIDQTIKTTIAANEPVDLAFNWTTGMKPYADADMALDLTPYLEANNGEWKNTFTDGSLNPATIGGKVYAVPATPVFPLLLVNKDLTDKAGVTLSEKPTLDEFMSALKTIKEKLGITPFGTSWPAWHVTNNLMTIWDNDEQQKEFAEGKIPFTDPRVVKALDAAKAIYDNDYAYPGKGALTVTGDQVTAAFKSEKVAMIAMINFLAEKTVMDSGLKNIQIVSFPHMGERFSTLGSANGYMIPANVKHPEASIEILKYLTSKEVLQKRVDGGSPVTNKDVTITNPRLEAYAKGAGTIDTDGDIAALSPKFKEYFDKKMPANYVFNPKKTLEELEKLRLEAIQKK